MARRRASPTPPHPSPRARRRPSAPTDTSLLEIRFKGAQAAKWIQELEDRWGATVRLHVCRPFGSGGARILRLFEVDAPPAQMGPVWAFLLDHVGAENTAVTRIAPNRLMVWTSMPMPRLCSAVFEAGAVCTTCPYLPPPAPPDGHGWGILVPHASDAQLPLDAMNRPGRPAPSVIRIGRYQERTALTPRQERAIEVALNLGYFMHPRRAELKDVARALGVSRSTAMEILRRATMKLALQRRASGVAARAIT